MDLFQVPEVQNRESEGYCSVLGLCALYNPLYNLHEDILIHGQFQ